MDIFAHLENSVQHLLNRIEDLGDAETRARQKLDEAEQRCSVLEEENRTLRENLAQEQILRRDAMARIDELVLRIRTQVGEE